MAASRSPAVRAVAPTIPLGPLGVNWRGLWTLYLKEVRRFLNVFTQTVAAPTVTTLLFLAVLTLALGGAGRIVQGVPFEVFLAPGLVIMTMAQNAFANTSSSLVMAKVQGNYVDFLMPPLSPGELTVGFSLAGLTRGLLVGAVVGLAVWVFVPMRIAHPGFVLFHGIAGSLMLSLLGVAGGIWSDKWDHLAAVTNFVVTPFAFLSGTFYSVTALPPFWHAIAHLDPFFYMIDGFRYGFIDQADGALWPGVLVMIGVDAALALLCWRMFVTGYKLKA